MICGGEWIENKILVGVLTERMSSQNQVQQSVSDLHATELCCR
jgi:hypothetical protein